MLTPVRMRAISITTLALALAGLAAPGCKGCGCGEDPTARDSAPPPMSDSGTDSGGNPDSGGSSDGGDGGPTTMGECGNSVLEPPEQCDDGNTSDDDQCLTDCTLACGDGMVGMTEDCDVAIAAGDPGSCPTACDDGDPCTIDSLDGGGCGVVCMNTPSVQIIGGITIGMFIDGDGCCAPAANANVDADCSPSCGNGVLEMGETCDPSSSCPSACDDGNACTADALGGMGGTCDAACGYAPIAACTDGDGCCPAGCCNGSLGGCTSPDADCSVSCGDSVLDTGEACDPPSSCPTSCDDGDDCTTDQLVGSAANCSAACSATPITMPVGGDACCPPGADANGDTDCSPICGNGVTEAGETCDDGNSSSNDGCDSACQGEITVFRLTDMDIRDPHIMVDAPLLGCTDATDLIPLMLAPAVNESIQDSMTGDWDANGFLDVSVLLMFNPLDQAGAGGPLTVASGLCVPPWMSTMCALDPTLPVQPTFYGNGSGTCLGALPGTTTPFAGGYAPPITESTGPCFVSGTVTLSLDLEGTLVPLEDTSIGATYAGAPATSLTNGLVRGFIAETTADAILLPMAIPFVGMMPLSVVLPGGTGNCATWDDRDLGPDGLTIGWWVYGNFVAETVPYAP